MISRHILVGPHTQILRLGGRPPRITAVLLGVHATTFLLLAFADIPLAWLRHIALSAEGLWRGLELWQPLSALWLHLELRSAVFDALILWIVGSALERWWGPKRYFWFILATALGGLLGGALAGLAAPGALLTGIEGASAGLLLALVVTFPQHVMHLHQLTPLKVQPTVLIFGGITLLGALVSRLWLDLAVMTAGLLTALFFLSPGKRLSELKLRRRARHLHLVQSGKKDEKRYLN